jgi:hypothetical protein
MDRPERRAVLATGSRLERPAAGRAIDRRFSSSHPSSQPFSGRGPSQHPTIDSGLFAFTARWPPGACRDKHRPHRRPHDGVWFATRAATSDATARLVAVTINERRSGLGRMKTASRGRADARFVLQGGLTASVRGGAKGLRPIMDLCARCQRAGSGARLRHRCA